MERPGPYSAEILDASKGTDGTTYYEIAVSDGAGSKTILRKRFNQFKVLHSTLSMQEPRLPAMPPKSVVRISTSGKFQQSRQNDLQQVLTTALAMDSKLERFTSLREFLEIKAKTAPSTTNRQASATPDASRPQVPPSAGISDETRYQEAPAQMAVVMEDAMGGGAGQQEVESKPLPKLTISQLVAAKMVTRRWKQQRLARLNQVVPELSNQLEDEPSEVQADVRAQLEFILHTIILSPKWAACLLLCAPAGIACGVMQRGDGYIFWLNFLALIPLAKILGDATEELAASLNNDMLSGLLNATFGNAVEMIMTVTFLMNHEYIVVKTALVGSILSNLLLVLGMSFLLGGFMKLKTSRGAASEPLMHRQPTQGAEKFQNYSAGGAMINIVMLLMFCLVLVLMTVFDYAEGHAEASDQHFSMVPISRACSVLVMVSYLMYIVFQLFTHKDAMGDEEDGEDGEEDGEQATLSMKSSMILLCVATVVVSICSMFLTNALEGALKSCPVPLGKAFVGTILLPIVGNACEHAAAIRFALKDKPGISVGIAVGSSVQMAMFVTPFAVLMGWAMGDGPNGENMDLDFGEVSVAVVTMSVLFVMFIVVDGRSNWLEGWVLCTVYCIVAVLYWYLSDKAFRT